MYLKRFLVASVFGFMWYFSDYGQVTLQLGVLICVLFSLNFFRSSVECSTQTDELAENPQCQEVDEDMICSGRASRINSLQDELQHGFQYLNVKRSLREVFECAYAQSVLPWYTAPESTINQPLHGALKTEFDLFVDRLICRARDFDLCAASVGCIRILTQHLHNAKQSTGAPLFSSRTEEMAVLRVFSEALVRNLLPDTLWDLELYRCILNEVVAVKVLDLLVTWLSAPDNLNQLVVSQLDRVAVSTSVESLCGSQRDDEASSSDTEDTGDSTDEEEDVPKKRKKKKERKTKGGKRLKEGWTKFLDKMKTKKAKKKELKMKEQELIRRALSHRRAACCEAGEGEEDGGRGEGSNQGSCRSSQIGSDGEEDSDLESYLKSVQEDMMEFKLSYEMWRVGNWTVAVNKVLQMNEELCFTVHIEERDNPDNLHWDVIKTDTELLHFHSRWQDMSGLPSISAIVGDRGKDLDEAFLDDAKGILQNFLQELVADERFGHSQPVFQFLCPLDRLLSDEEPCTGVWGLLSGIAYFLTPGQEEDEHNGPGADAHAADDMKTTAVAIHEPEVAHRSTQVTNQEQHARGDTAEPHPACLNVVSSTHPNSRRCSYTNSKDFNEPNHKDCARTSGKDCTEEPVLTNGNGPEESEDLAESSGPFISGLATIAGSFDELLAKAKAAIPKMHQTILTQTSDCTLTSISTSTTSLTSLHDTWPQTGSKVSKRDKLLHRMSAGRHRTKGRADQGCQGKENMPPLTPLEKNASQRSSEHLEATKAIFDLLKEISGNSLILNIFDAILKPVMPLVKKKVNSFLDRMNPTEEQMASYIDIAREKQWPNGVASVGVPKPPRSHEEMHDTRERAQQLINTRYSNYLILKKTDVETVFKLFQETEENKKLVYMLLSFLLHEFLPGEPALHVIAQLYVKDIT